MSQVLVSQVLAQIAALDQAPPRRQQEVILLGQVQEPLLQEQVLQEQVLREQVLREHS